MLVMTVFSFNGAYANIAYTDILGKVILPVRRKRLLMVKQVISRAGVIVSAFYVKQLLSRLPYPIKYSTLFLLAGLLLLFGTIGFWMIIKPEGTGAPKTRLNDKLKAF